MGYRTFVRVARVAIIVSLLGGGVARAGVTLGASFGYSHLSYPDLPDFSNNVVGIPGAASWGQPGLRVGYLAPGGHWDVNGDVGFIRRSGSVFGDESSTGVLTQLQWNAGARGTLTPYVNVGFGLMHERALVSAFRSVGATRPALGVGVGLRRPVSDDHGFLRVELRYDRLAKSEKRLDSSFTFIFPAIDMFSVKLGFDLLVTRQR